jgi:hypothetical protein
LKIGDWGLRRMKRRKDLRSEGSLWPIRAYAPEEGQRSVWTAYFLFGRLIQSSCGEIVLNAVQAFADKYSGFDTTFLTQ